MGRAVLQKSWGYVNFKREFIWLSLYGETETYNNFHINCTLTNSNERQHKLQTSK